LIGAFIVLILLPEVVGIVMTGPLLVNIFLGEQFRPLTLALLPFLVGATFLKALMLYVSYGYFLAERTGYTLLSGATAAVVNIGLNLVLIPRYGAWGAAVAAVAGFAAAFAVAAIPIRRVFPFPLPDVTMLAAAFAAIAVMTLWLWPFYHVTAWIAVTYVVPIALVLYFGSLVLFLRLAKREPLALIRAFWKL
jgi:O-antigen/teichoic acid export membrane protein